VYNKSSYRIRISDKCNNNCVFCKDLDIKGHELETEAVKKKLDSIRKTHTKITFPCNTDSRSDFQELIEYAEFLGFEITLQTNGRMFSYLSLARFMSSKVKFEVFLNGTKREHNSVCRTDSFHQTINGIKNLLSLNAQVQVNSVITRYNYRSHKNIVSLLKEIGVKNFRPIFPVIKEQSKYIPKISECYSEIDNAIKLARRNGTNVVTGDLFHNPFIPEDLNLDYSTAEVRYEYKLSFRDLVTKPKIIFLDFSSKCNLKCIHCDLHKTDKHDGLSIESIKTIVKKLKNWLGPFTLRLSGAEPLMRKDFLQMIKFCTKKSVSVGFVTNGSLLSRGLIEILKKEKIAYISVSIDGIWDHHDDIRKQKGLFSKAVNSLNMMKNCGIPTHIVTVIMNQNLDEIIKIVEFAEKNNLYVNFQPIFQPFGQEYSPDWYKISDLWPDDIDKVVQIIDDLIKIKSENGPIINSLEQLKIFKRYFREPEKQILEKCNVASHNLIINNECQISFCFGIRGNQNIINNEPEEIWISSDTQLLKKRVDICKKNCSILNCHYDQNSAEKKISIIIPTYNRKNLLEVTLNSLFNLDYPKDQYEIIVIDDGGRDETLEMIKNLIPTCNLKYIYWPRHMPYVFGEAGNRAGPTRNVGVMHSTGKILLFLDSDMIAEPNLLNEHLKHVRDGVSVLGLRKNLKKGVQVTSDIPITEDNLDPPIRAGKMLQDLDFDLSGHQAPWFFWITANVSVTRTDFLNAGGFSDDFVFWGNEDQELGYRLCQNKIKYHVNTKAVGYHQYHEIESVNQKIFWINKIRHIDILYRKHLDKNIYKFYQNLPLREKKNDTISKEITIQIPSQLRYPKRIYVELTRNCNMSCIMCTRKQNHDNYYDEKLNMSFDLFKEIADELFPHADFVDLRGFGESTLVPNIMDYWRYASKFNVNAGLITNLSFDNDILLAYLVENNFWIGISIDGADKETYGNIREESYFEQVINNIKTLVKLTIKYKEDINRLYLLVVVSKK